VSGVLVAFLVSILAGGFGSIVGIGGGLIIVPLLTSALFDIDIKVAIAASLVGVIATSIGASGRYLATGIADRRLGVILLVATAIGGLVGGLTGQLVEGRVLALLFAALLVFVAFQMSRQLWGPPPRAADDDGTDGFASHYLEPSTGERVSYRARRVGLGAAASFVAGNVSGLLGVGGGLINVPTMSLLMRVPIRVATTTSTYMLGATAATSAMISAAAGVLDPLIAAPVALGVFVGARGGAWLALRLSTRTLRIAFVGLCLLFAVQMVLKAAGS
jgi:uncharacterized membrane protein YfcA